MLQAYQGYFENGRFYTAGQTIPIPERQQIILTILEEPPVQDETMTKDLAAMDDFINAIQASDETVPEFKRLKLREVGRDMIYAARIVPLDFAPAPENEEFSAFGMWKDREDMKDPSKFVAKLRKGRGL
jgi:hypothetical protein